MKALHLSNSLLSIQKLSNSLHRNVIVRGLIIFLGRESLIFPSLMLDMFLTVWLSDRMPLALFEFP